jgi:hypothetical protein
MIFTSGIPERGRLRPLFIPISKGLDTVLALGKGLDTKYTVMCIRYKH